MSKEFDAELEAINEIINKAKKARSLLRKDGAFKKKPVQEESQETTESEDNDNKESQE